MQMEQTKPRNIEMNYSQLHDMQAAQEELKWYAVYTKYKREKLIHRRLKEKGIETYLPLQQFTRHYKRKKRVVELPLISCYLFTKITRKEEVPVLETPDVVQFVKFNNKLAAIPEEEIRLMKRIVGEEVELEVEPAGLRRGDVVEIIGGNLTGVRGILLQKQSKKNFLVELTHTGYALCMQIDPALLRAVKRA